MRAKDFTPDQRLAVRCQACGARPGQPCELHSGGLRTEPHKNRRLSAADVETRQLADVCFPTSTSKGFCEICRNLIEQLSALVSSAFVATTRLNELAGAQNSAAFAAAKTVARRAREACKEARVNLSRHRLEHDCQKST